MECQGCKNNNRTSRKRYPNKGFKIILERDINDILNNKKIYGNKSFSGIQLSTASGICANVMLWAQGELPAGPLKQEDIPFDKWITNRFGKLYAQ